MQLFCFTYAGGNAAFFNLFDSYSWPNIDMLKLEYAGHGKRRKEQFYTDFSELAEDMYRQISLWNKNGEAYALFGYSMGSISVIETVKKILERRELVPPVHIFLAAHEPCARKELEGFDEAALDDWIRKRVIQFGGVPERLVHNKSFWRVYLPVYRADYQMIGKYDFERINLKSRIPATIFYSESDTPYSLIKDWKHYFIGECDLIPFEGNHFFIYGHKQEIADVMVRKLDKVSNFKRYLWEKDT